MKAIIEQIREMANKGNLYEAIQLAKKHKDNWEALYILGVCYFANKDYCTAAYYFKESLNLKENKRTRRYFTITCKKMGLKEVKIKNEIIYEV